MPDRPLLKSRTFRVAPCARTSTARRPIRLYFHGLSKSRGCLTAKPPSLFVPTPFSPTQAIHYLGGLSAPFQHTFCSTTHLLHSFSSSIHLTSSSIPPSAPHLLQPCVPYTSTIPTPSRLISASSSQLGYQDSAFRSPTTHTYFRWFGSC